MLRFYSYLNTAKVILSQYKGDMPFSAFIKSFFAQEKKYGSRDRRTIASMCYNYFRTGLAIENKSVEERMLISLYLCSDTPNELLQNEKPEWNEKIGLPLTDKLLITETDVQKIFPFNEELSLEMDITAFNYSFLNQAKVFVRIRPGKHAAVKQKLLKAQIDFEEVGKTCLSFSTGIKLEQVLDINREVVIQDFNSQRVGEMLTLMKVQNQPSVWDCCAASGGKSIMAYDLLPGITLTASDVRQSIMQNLHKRFKDAGIESYQSFVANLSDQKNLQSVLKEKRFDIIICDAPCSGSGTWSRTPEQLLYFKSDEISRYSSLQKRIVMHTYPCVKNGGYFLYITCSVFKQENEEVVEFIQQQSNLALLKTELLKGYNIKADTMFAALFQSPA